MNRILIYLLVGTLSYSMASCKKWLDEKTDDKVFIDDALSDRKGFAGALSGIYNSMGQADLYGGELEFRLLDVLVGYWKINSNSPYDNAYSFNYQNAGVKKRLAVIWSGLYTAIHQCNVLLAHIDNIKEDPYYPIVKGEILGLRGYLHLEVFKLFGPVIQQKGLDTPSVPYYDHLTNLPQPALSSRVFLTAVELDLQQARKLLMNDPIITQGRDSNGQNVNATDYNSLVDRRGIRMNYYAVLALLARKSQWAGDLAQAGVRADEAIKELNKSKAIHFADNKESEDTDSLKDRRFSSENIWSLYINKLPDRTENYFNNLGSFDELLPAYSGFLENIYTRGSGSSSDYRINYWGINSTAFSKLSIPDFPENTPTSVRDVFFEIQLINLPELYFIVAEASLNFDLNRTLVYINEIRVHRNLPVLAKSAGLSRETIQGYLLDEIRREYIGEGYLFSYLKHLYYPIDRYDGKVAANEAIFVFPIPEDEFLYNK